MKGENVQRQNMKADDNPDGQEGERRDEEGRRDGTRLQSGERQGQAATPTVG